MVIAPVEHATANEIVISGVGVTSVIGQGRDAFTRALLAGTPAMGVMQRPGRQRDSAFLGAELPALLPPSGVAPQPFRRLSLTAQAALVTVREAWDEARLDRVDPTRVGLIVGGSNLQQRELTLAQQECADRPRFVRPTYAVSFMDTDICGICTEHFGIRGLAYALGGASASGQLAIIQAMHAVRTGQVDVCIALGALVDLSFWELRAFANLGAMGSERYAAEPGRACRPFDRDCDGFIYGEACGAVVVEAASHAAQREREPYATISGWGMVIDAKRNPDPSLDGEIRVIEMALRRADIAPERVDYINPHGTGSRLGDATEVGALVASGLTRAHINATKSITGHGLAAAGAVEVVATLMQMRAGQLHPTRNLEHPIDESLRWVHGEARPHAIDTALTLSFGFGGINTALLLRRRAG